MKKKLPKTKPVKEGEICRLYFPIADMRKLTTYLNDFSHYRIPKNYDQIKVRENALKLIDLCFQGLRKNQPMDLRLNFFLQDALLKIILSDDPAKAAADAFYLRPGRGKSKNDGIEERNKDIAVAVQRKRNDGAKLEEAVKYVAEGATGEHLGMKNVERIYLENEIYAKAFLCKSP